MMFGIAILSRQTIERIHEVWRLRMEMRQRDLSQNISE
jgi:hypothetical protein